MSRDAPARGSADAPVLAVEGLTKLYGRKKAVSDVGFSVGQGELVGLLGPNGAGKSSTLRMIAGCLAPTAGCIRIAGFDVAEEPGWAKSLVGYLPEIPPLYPDMTVGEYLRFARDLKRASGDDPARMQGLVAALEIEGVLSSLIRSLSKGYRQRVGIAASLAGRPALLLLDEPTSGLDPRQAADLRSLLRRVSADTAIVVSSHDLYEISSLCTRIIVMSEGRIVADGRPDELARGSGGQRTELEASGNLGLAAEILRACAGDSRIVEIPVGEGRLGFVVYAGGADFRERIFRFFSARSAEVSLNTLRASETSLEDMFINLTKPEKT
jgi:ABC-2 type transport system ATP-binding protein